MTCLKAQSLITPFINNELDIKELEEFLEHVRSCKDCREELEVYYALLTAMKQLDEEKDLSDDFSLELSEKMEKAQEKIIHIRYNYYRKKGMLMLFLFLLTLFFGLQHYLRDKEPVNPVTESNFRLRIFFGERFLEDGNLEEELKRYLMGQGLNRTDQGDNRE